MPTTASNTYTDNFGTPSQRPDVSMGERYQMKVSTTLDPGAGKKFIAVGVVTATGKIAAYADANVDGTGICIGFVRGKYVSDSSGNITVNGGTVTAQVQTDLFVFQAGIFDLSQVTGFDAAALADLKARQLWGATDLSTGEIVIAI